MTMDARKEGGGGEKVDRGMQSPLASPFSQADACSVSRARRSQREQREQAPPCVLEEEEEETSRERRRFPLFLLKVERDEK